MKARRFSFEEPPRQTLEASPWRFTLGLLIGLALCGAAALQWFH